jgi:hypothetical protein
MEDHDRARASSLASVVGRTEFSLIKVGVITSHHILLHRHFAELTMLASTTLRRVAARTACASQ